MVTKDEHFSANETDVAARVLDGEAVVIDLTNGRYHSMDGVGGYVWPLVEAGTSLDELVRAVATAYDEDVDVVRKDLTNLLGDLRRASLVESIDPEEATPGGLDDTTPAPSVPTGEYVTPRLETHKDMEAMLALDPPMPSLDEAD